jgi:hypothetical protein
MSAEPPVLPGADEARRWATEELAKPEYREAAPSWLETVWENFLEWFASLDGSTESAGPLPSPVIGIVIALIIAAAVILARPRLNAASRKPREVFEPDTILTAGDYRQRAEASAMAGKWGDAVVDRFRALARSAEDRAILDPQPGRTADEVVHDLTAAFPAEARRLDNAARTFDAVRYGNMAPSSSDYHDIVALDGALEAGKPERDRTSRPPAVLP